LRIALLKGNRFNPWHLEVFKRLRGAPDVVAFRADSEIQDHFAERGAASLDFPVEVIHFDTRPGILGKVQDRIAPREPRILPFHERLQGFDLIQTWELFTDWSDEAITAKEKYGIPAAVMVWDNIPFNNEQDERRRGIKARVKAAADVFLVHTERSRRMLLIEGVDDDRIVHIQPGVDLERFSPGPETNAAKDEFTILFVGWLLLRKGIDFLLLALHQLRNDPELQHIRIHLNIVGSGPGRERVDQLIERLDLDEACTFLGAVPYTDMPDVYRAADAFVLPSIATDTWQEQFGMSLIEAMACGIPTIASFSGAIPEIAGDSALVQPNDFLAIYEELRMLIYRPDTDQSALRSARSRQALARAEQYFDINTQAEKLSDIYTQLTKS
jgi:glycosyltransferase involved in cell wall biosynthesis